MNKFVLSTTLLLITLTPLSFADDTQQVITLKDGSQIKGVLAGIDNGVYTVKTPIIGDVHVAASDVASITNGNLPQPAPVAEANTAAALTPGADGSQASGMDQQVANTQRQLMANPQSMALLQKMAENPEIMQALQDPAVVQAVTTHDYAAVQSNPAIQKLMSDPQMQALLQQLAAQQHQQNSTSQ